MSPSATAERNRALRFYLFFVTQKKYFRFNPSRTKLYYHSLLKTLNYFTQFKHIFYPDAFFSLL